MAAGRKCTSTATAGSATACNGSSIGCRIYPGAGNGLSYRGRPLTNWWTFIGDFDAAMAQGLRLTSTTAAK